MKYYKHLAWMMAIAIACTMLTACSSDDNETEKPFTTDPVICFVNNRRLCVS